MKFRNYNKLIAEQGALYICIHGQTQFIKNSLGLATLPNSLEYLAKLVENQFRKIAGIYMEIQPCEKI